MTTPTRLAALALAAATTLGAADLASAGTYDIFLNVPSQTTVSQTVDGVALTAAVTITPLSGGRTNFTNNATGAGIDSRFNGPGFDQNQASNQFNRFQINEYETYRFSFDAAGTLNTIELQTLTQAAAGTINVMNQATGLSASYALDAQTDAQDETFANIGLAFGAGDVLAFSHTGVAGYRLQEVTITPAAAVPEPVGAASVLGLGGLLLGRRRRD